MPTYSSQFPDPIALVTVATKTRTNVMTVGWASPVSSKPPILMVSVAPRRFTHDLILEAGEFGLSILANDQKKLSELAGTLTGSKVDKLAKPEFETFDAEKIRAPLIKGARAWFECTLHSHQTVGDHTVFYGAVLKTRVDETKSPLVLFHRRYYALGEERGVYP
ncbi:MAG: flavin reductase family protein [Candidatus Latescibacterota bacterium]|nr:MAG: flavin reductase family protein [Candidatus Latescibacterota bacterium]